MSLVAGLASAPFPCLRVMVLGVRCGKERILLAGFQRPCSTLKRQPTSQVFVPKPILWPLITSPSSHPSKFLLSAACPLKCLLGREEWKEANTYRTCTNVSLHSPSFMSSNASAGPVLSTWTASPESSCCKPPWPSHHHLPPGLLTWPPKWTPCFCPCLGSLVTVWEIQSFFTTEDSHVLPLLECAEATYHTE